MTDVPAPHRHFQANFQTNLIAGLLTVTPLIVVWLVFDFFLDDFVGLGPSARRGTDDIPRCTLPGSSTLSGQ